MKEINIGLLGCGTVGTGVAKILIENKDLISSRVGASLTLKYIADIDTEKDRGVRFDSGVLIADAHKVVNDPDIDIIVEMIGGEGIAKNLIIEALDNRKHVVTANKALLAKHGNVIFKTTADKGVDLAFEASVGGCMPIIKAMRESLVGNSIESMTGILNGTCNYILSRITDNGDDFNFALSSAQAKGFAEADPTLDIEGIDTAHKLAILICLAYGMEMNFDDIYIEGISKISPIDINCAKQFNYKIKLLAISKNKGNQIEARVHPTMIPFDNVLSNVNGSFNALSISGDAAGEMMFYGHGAGMMPTASAVIGDIVDIARNILSGAKNRIPLLSYQMQNIKKIPVMSIDEIFTNYYFRISVLDRAGVLAKIGDILGKRNISMKFVQQTGQQSNGAVPIVILTHLAKEANVQKAISEIARLDVVQDKPVVIRIEDKNAYNL